MNLWRSPSPAIKEGRLSVDNSSWENDYLPQEFLLRNIYNISICNFFESPKYLNVATGIRTEDLLIEKESLFQWITTVFAIKKLFY